MASEGRATWRGEADMHPWHCIAEELLARGWSTEDLAIRMAIPDYDALLSETSRNLLILDLYRHVGPTHPNCRIGEKPGRDIARAFGLHEDMIVNMDRSWREEALANQEAPTP